MKIKLIFSAALACASLGIGLRAQDTDTLVSKQPQNRHVLLEEYTGMQCTYCPQGHVVSNQIAAQHPGEFFTVNVHCTTKAAPPNASAPDLQTSYGDPMAMRAVGGLSIALPTGTLNRHVFEGNAPEVDRSDWERYTDSILSMPAYANIGGIAKVDWNTRQMEIVVQIYCTDSVPVNENRLHVFLLQDNIIGYQASASSNPEQNLGGNMYRHMHVLRDIPTGMEGVPINGLEKGSFVEQRFTATLPEYIRNVELELADLSVLAFLSEDYYEVINVAELPIHFEEAGPVFTFNSGQQVDLYRCGTDIKVGFELENLTYQGEALREIGFRLASEGKEHVFTMPVEGGFGYRDALSVETDAFPLLSANRPDTVEVSVCSVNGEEYSLPGQKTLRIPVVKYANHTSQSSVTLNLWQDGFGTETQWVFFSETGDTLATGGPYEDIPLTQEVVHTEEIALQAGCNVFKLLDSQGDGINNIFGEGHFDIRDAESVLIEHDGKFADSVLVFIQKTGVGNEASDPAASTAFTARLYPNPTQGKTICYLQVESRESREMEIDIFNLSGQKMLSIGRITATGAQTFELPVGNLPAGLYLVRLDMGASAATLRLVISR